MQNTNSTTKTFDMIKLLLQNLFDIAYLALCYTLMFPRSIFLKWALLDQAQRKTAFVNFRT